jgi:hypothetical protein
VLVVLDRGLQQARTGQSRRGRQIRRHIGFARRCLRIVTVPHQRLHRHEVDHATEVGLGADRQLQRQHRHAERRTERRERPGRAGPCGWQ